MTTIKRDPLPFLPLTPAAFHVLLTLADGPKHGYLILKDVEERTNGEVRLSTGTLYGLIKRFLDDELIVETRGARPVTRERCSQAFWRRCTRSTRSGPWKAFALSTIWSTPPRRTGARSAVCLPSRRWLPCCSRRLACTA